MLDSWLRHCASDFSQTTSCLPTADAAMATTAATCMYVINVGLDQSAMQRFKGFWEIELPTKWGEALLPSSTRRAALRASLPTWRVRFPAARPLPLARARAV